MKAVAIDFVLGAASILLSLGCTNSGKTVTSAVPQAQEISNVKDNSNSADYLVIYGDGLHDAAASFAAYRKSSSCSPSIVGYNVIASAFPVSASSRPLRGFFNYVDTSWAHAPKQVLLLGDAGAHGVPFADTLVFGDSTYSDAGTDSLLTFSVGRIPCYTNDQALAVLDKIKKFEKDLPEKVRFIVDSPGSIAGSPDPLAGFFPTTFHDISLLINGTTFSQDSFMVRDFGIDTAQWTDSVSNLARTALFRFLNSGTGYVSYIGHANNARISSRILLNLADIDSLSAANLYVICGSFVTDLTRDTVLAKALLFRQHAGAVAVIGNSYYQYVNDEERFQSGFFVGLTQGKYAALGDLFKAAVLSSTVTTVPASVSANKTKLLLGDPAMVIRRR